MHTHILAFLRHILGEFVLNKSHTEPFFFQVVMTILIPLREPALAALDSATNLLEFSYIYRL